MLSQICALQKSYGKTRDEIETLVEGFAWVLEGYEMPEITAAMRAYVLNKSDIPAPADILSLIKERRVYANVKAPDLEQLRAYRSKGLPLTPHQQQLLDEAK